MKKLLVLMLFSTWIFTDDLFLNPNNPTPWIIQNEDIPEINNQVTVFLGDIMLKQRYGQYHECLKSKINVDKTIAGGKYSIKKGGIFCLLNKKDSELKQSSGKKYYYPNYKDIYGEYEPALFKKGKGQVNIKMNGWSIKKLSLEEFKDSFEPISNYVIANDSIQRTIEYSGKSGSVLSFIYSEFKDDKARPAFTREFKIDLNEGNLGAYKGAVFEVIEATNAFIKYKIIRYLPYNF